MPMIVDFAWLRSIADDDATRRELARIEKEREEVMRTNVMPADSDEVFPLLLGGRTIWLRRDSAFSAVEIYQEVFQADDHCILPTFSRTGHGLVLDIGANMGLYGMKMAWRNPGCRILSVEPNPRMYDLMCRNVRSNGLELSNALSGITPLPYAIGAECGVLPLEIVRQIGAIGGRQVRGFGRTWLKDADVSVVNVEMTTLDQLVARGMCEGSIVSVLKIDVEGMEDEVLAGAAKTLERTTRVVVERHSLALRDGVVDRLVKAGFTLVRDEDPEGKRYYGDLYFERQ